MPNRPPYLIQDPYTAQNFGPFMAGLLTGGGNPDTLFSAPSEAADTTKKSQP